MGRDVSGIGWSVVCVVGDLVVVNNIDRMEKDQVVNVVIVGGLME